MFVNGLAAKKLLAIRVFRENKAGEEKRGTLNLRLSGGRPQWYPLKQVSSRGFFYSADVVN